VGASRATFALPSTTTHLHNFHSASESDGGPEDWIDSGEFWDHHYCNFPSGHDPREKLTTLWYHDHRMDFTAANVYAGLSGFHLYFDEQDTGDENDPSPEAWRLPSWYLEKSTLTSYRWATLMNSSRARTGRRSGWAAPGAGSPSAAPTGC